MDLDSVQSDIKNFVDLGDTPASIVDGQFLIGVQQSGGDILQFFDLFGEDNTWSGEQTFTETVTIDLDEDEIGLIVQAHSGTPTANVVEIQDSSGIDVWNVTYLGTTTQIGNIIIDADNKALILGADQDMDIGYDGIDGYLRTDLVTASDLNIDCGTEKTIKLVSTVFKDLQLPVSGAKVPAVNAPAWQTFTTNTREYGFSVGDYIDFEANEIPHWWAEGTNGRPHLHITTRVANNTGSNRYAKFTVYIAYADTGETWVETSFTAELTIPDGTPALSAFLLDMGSDLILTNYLIESQIKCRVERISATGGPDVGGAIFITQLGIHLEVDTMGSRQISAK